MEPHGVEHTERARVSVRTAAGGSAGPDGGSAVRRATALAGGWTTAHPLAESLRPSDAVPTLSRVLAAAAERSAAEGRAADSASRVDCPGCDAEYGLPPGLTPPWGGRVRCPKCRTVFSVGVRAEADRLVAGVAAADPPAWERACGDQSLWAMWGQELLEAYAALRERYGPQIASRAFRRALEDAAPGVPWFAPPTPSSPLEPELAAADAGGTMFERRQGS
jgi:predicted Zn finger-like uncharacterized protein